MYYMFYIPVVLYNYHFTILVVCNEEHVFHRTIIIIAIIPQQLILMHIAVARFPMNIKVCQNFIAECYNSTK